MYIFIYMHTHTHTHVHIYIYTHTHTHTRRMLCVSCVQVQSNHILKVVAKAAVKHLDAVWFKYVDDKLQIIIQYLLLGADANVDDDLVEEGQEWLFRWAILYCKHMHIKFTK